MVKYATYIFFFDYFFHWFGFEKFKCNPFQNSGKYMGYLQNMVPCATFLGNDHLDLTNVSCDVETEVKESEAYLEY